MSTVSSISNPYVIPHTVNDSNPSQTALEKGLQRNIYQHNLVNVSKIGGSKSNKKKSKRGKSKHSKTKSRRRFSRKFRKTLRLSLRKSMLRRRNKNKKIKKLSRGGGGGNGSTMTIPSFSQTTPNGTNIINQLASNHAQTLAYSTYDGDVKAPAAAPAAAAK
jgi:hypothetical protein